MKSLKIALIALASLLVSTTASTARAEPFSYENFRANMESFSSTFGSGSSLNNNSFTANGSSGSETGFTSYSTGANVGGSAMSLPTIGNNGNGNHNNNTNPEATGSNFGNVGVEISAGRSPNSASASTNTFATTNSTSVGNMFTSGYSGVFSNVQSFNFPPMPPLPLPPQ